MLGESGVVTVFVQTPLVSRVLNTGNSVSFYQVAHWLHLKGTFSN